MKNQRQSPTEDDIERTVTADELLSQIKPLLDDYFIGEVSKGGSFISYRLPNGQKFKLVVEEIA